MFYQILILFFGPNLFEYVRTKEIRPYFCDSKAKIDEIKNISYHLKRLIRHDDKIFFILKNRIIFTKIPELFWKDDEVANELYENSIFFENFNFYEQENSEIDSLPSLVPNGYSIYGYCYDEDKNLTTELYYNRSRDEQLLKTQIFDEVYELDFKSDVLASRKEIKERPKFLDPEFYGHKANSLYLISIKSNNYHIFARFDNLSISEQSDQLNKTLVIVYHFFNQSITSSGHFKLYRLIQDLPNTKLFVFSIYLPFVYAPTSLFFLAIDEITFKINLINYGLNLTKKQAEDIKLKLSVGANVRYEWNILKEIKIKFNFDEFFRYMMKLEMFNNFFEIYLNFKNTKLILNL